jgi:hypothetical protein
VYRLAEGSSVAANTIGIEVVAFLTAGGLMSYRSSILDLHSVVPRTKLASCPLTGLFLVWIGSAARGFDHLGPPPTGGVAGVPLTPFEPEQDAAQLAQPADSTADSDAAKQKRSTGVVDRHKGERVERDKKTDCADQTRRDSPRIQELKDQPNKHRLPLHSL